MKKAALTLVALLTLCACHHNTTPDGVLDTAEMSAFLVDAYLLESYNAIENRSNPTDPTPAIRSAYDDILRRHGVTQQEVEASLDYYGKHPDEYRVILGRVSARLDAESNQQR